MSRVLWLRPGRAALVLLVAGLAILGSVGRATWATPAQDPQRQTVPTRTPTSSPSTPTLVTPTLVTPPSASPTAAPGRSPSPGPTVVTPPAAPLTPDATDPPPVGTPAPASPQVPSPTAPPETEELPESPPPPSGAEGSGAGPATTASASLTPSVATPEDTRVAPGGATAIVADTPLPPPSDRPVPSAGSGQMWVPVALLLVMTVLMLRRGRV